MAEMNERVPRWAWLVLRVCVGLPAIASGIFNAINWDASNEFNSILLGGAAPVLTILGIAQILAGLLIITGYQLRLGVAIMLAFWIPATIRHFLAARALVGDDPLVILAKRGQLSCVEKNVGLIGVMIFLFVADLRVRLTSGTSSR
ncbi:MAG: DoxX family protein [Thermoanaerobaculia bacterium]|nr:DoxX family protein [Thermoanaerobaculia bacterium]MBP9825314.1 DoxX family protein [Thermoanaerobaculia bacterium]